MIHYVYVVPVGSNVKIPDGYRLLDSWTRVGTQGDALRVTIVAAEVA